jgi:hypothetical protein
MDQLFKALPRDLQWEILSEFVGTHVVRNGKLKRKIVYGTMNLRLMRQLEDNTFIPVINPHRLRMRLAWLNDLVIDARPKYIRFTTLGNQQMKFCDDGIAGDTIFCYRKIVDHHVLWEVQYPVLRAADAVTLPPFVKHSYPSYEHTNKKRRIPLVR